VQVILGLLYFRPAVAGIAVVRAQGGVAFIVVSTMVGLLTALALLGRVHPVVAVALGLVVGLVAGLCVAVLVVAWPVLRVLWHWLPELVAGGLVFGPLVRLAPAHPCWHWLLWQCRRRWWSGSDRCGTWRVPGPGAWWYGIGCGCASPR